MELKRICPLCKQPYRNCDCEDEEDQPIYVDWDHEDLEDITIVKIRLKKMKGD